MNDYLNKINELLPDSLKPKKITEESILRSISLLVTERNNSLFAFLNDD